MSDIIAPSGTVHWIGTGLSTGSGLNVLCDRARRVLLWARTTGKAEDRLARLGLSGRATARAFRLSALAAELRAGDVVVSMLPATEHAALLRLCIERRAHFACSSYATGAILAEGPAAARAGIVALIEAGLDPGIDHVLASRLIAEGRAAVGESGVSADFTSYCGGLPAVPNKFRYRFSWAPHGVLNALRQPARYIEAGVEKAIDHPWQATRPHVLDGETFEVYPNRDSIQFVDQYGVPPDWRLETFIRGTLRLGGWCAAWAPIFAELLRGSGDSIGTLADELAVRYPTTNADRDRVVLAVTLRLRHPDGAEWHGEYLLDVVGDETESAMSRCVSLPLAFGVSEILAGKTPAGLRRAAENAAQAQRWVASLKEHGIDCTFMSKAVHSKQARSGSANLTRIHRSAEGDTRHFKCVGIGVGPANLSLASLLRGYGDVPNLFIDKKDSFSWHDGQQLTGTSLQVSLFKDLVTLSDPTSDFSFLAYLHEQGKIYHFINAQFAAVPRQEFRNYLEWASCRNQNVVFGEEVLSVEFDGTFSLRTSGRTVTADNIAIGIGNQPWVPACAQGKLGPTQFHVSEFLYKVREIGGKHVCVVGGGQSGAEAVLDLISRPDDTLPGHVSWLSRRRNYLPIDDSPFTNDFYMPCHSDYFFNLDRAAREAFNAENVLTSDGISESTLREIYQHAYLRRFVYGAGNLVTFCPNREVTDVAERGASGWRLTAMHNDQPGAAEHIEADVIIWATGFRPACMDFLAPIERRLEQEDKEYKIDHDFAVHWDGPPDRGIFMQNTARQQRGLADPNLSLIAWRSQRIIDRLRGVTTDDQLPSFIEWSANPSVTWPRV
jgi:lysine N6-hydroxylase